MKELHTFGWYAAKISPLLPEEAFKPVPSRLIGGAIYLIIVITGILVISLFKLPAILSILISFILGCSFAGMGFLGHEILHGTVVKKSWLRDLLGGVSLWPLCIGPALWRKWHNMNHHVHTQHHEKDPDAWANMDALSKTTFFRGIYRLPYWFRTSVSIMILTIQLTLVSIRAFILFIKDFNPKNRRKVWFQLLLPWVTWIILLFITGPLKWFFAFLLPLAIGNFIVMSYTSTNHGLNPLTSVNDPLANSLTVTVPKWVNVLHFNFPYHTEHHIFPTVNPKFYPLVQQHIKELWADRYHEMPFGKALLAIFITPRVYYQDKELIDPRNGYVYGSLGNGLNPEKIQRRKVPID
ncbi:fatty acid desaturase [Bacillus subtilis]|uniref:fatty acid desaturase family protein n=1 Tax=Bacillus subtilis TaxID=1423 RepID=UPI001D0807AC|nr:fatty acid desaturase [Bacillus subtilis]MCB7162459.1 fatty acid desaturase [Bacillus subtilis]MCB7461324.1 fatty acid desaturase [Bacillus subtilis]